MSVVNSLLHIFRVVDWLDEYNPGSFRQASISMSSRIPHSIALGDAKTMSSHMLLYSNYSRLNIKSAVNQSDDKTATDRSGTDIAQVIISTRGWGGC